MTTYTTIGSVRGECGHRHKSIATAVRCIDKDDRGCKRSCGSDAYSDRVVRYTGGAKLPQDDYEDIAAGVYDAR